MSGYYQAIPFTLEQEGGFTVDTGGATMKGVTQAVYDRWRDKHGVPRRSVKEIEDDELHAIYYQGYWVAAQCDKLPWPVSMVHFDCAVNAGVKRAVKILQQAVGVPDDGVWGTKTQAAVRLADPVVLFNNLLWQRAEFYYALAQTPKYQPYLVGWLRRVVRLRRKARTLW